MENGARSQVSGSSTASRARTLETPGFHRPIILASQSPARKRLLKRLGFKFRAVPASLDEDAYKAGSPRQLVALLAREKARAVSERYPNAVVIGSDQMLVLGRKIFGKPHTRENAIAQLSACSGRTIELLTAVTVIAPPTSSGGGAKMKTSFTNVTRMKFRTLKRSEIEQYVDLDLPLECAGSFMIEKNGIRLFESIDSSDPTAIEGLPCLELAPILRHALNA